MYVLKGLKEALTILIVSHVTQVKRVESGVCSFYTTLHTEYCNVTLYTGPLAPDRREGYLSLVS